MGKAVEYNIPFGEDKYLIEKSIAYFAFNGTDNSCTTSIKPADITSTNPFIFVFKRKIGITPTYERYFSCGRVATSDYFMLRQNKTADRTDMLYSDTSNETFNDADFVTAGCQTGWCRIEIINDGAGNFEISIYNHLTNVQVSTTRTVAIGNLPDRYISLCCKDYDAVIDEWYDMDIAYIEGDGKVWYLIPYTSSSIIDSSEKTELTIQGTITSTQWAGDYYTPYENDLWKCLTKFYLKNKLYPASVTGYIHTILDENYRKFECIVKSCDREQTQLDYAMLKGWEGETITLRPHIDESDITYSCKIEFVELLYIENDTKNWVIVIYLIESTVL